MHKVEVTCTQFVLHLCLKLIIFFTDKKSKIGIISKGILTLLIYFDLGVCLWSHLCLFRTKILHACVQVHCEKLHVQNQSRLHMCRSLDSPDTWSTHNIKFVQLPFIRTNWDRNVWLQEVKTVYFIVHLTETHDPGSKVRQWLVSV